MGKYSHINKQYLIEVDKLKGKNTSRSFLRGKDIFRLIMLLVITTVILGLIAIFVMPEKYSHSLIMVIAAALIIGIAAIGIKVRNEPSTLSKDDDIIDHPSFKNMSCNIWHKDNDTNQ